MRSECPVVERPAARVLLLDPGGRVLLLRTQNLTNTAVTHPWLWLTPGGGLSPGEGWEEAARREVAEETGLERIDVGPCVWHRRHRWSQGGAWVESVERFLVARVPAFRPVRPVGTPEADTVAEARWWSAEEVEAAGDQVFVPRRLGPLLRELGRGPPGEPIDVGE